MAVRIKDGMIPYTGGIGIEITKNHVINLLLREANNLIHVDENNKVYVDLQLDDGIQPDDDFPVGVTTGKILEEDGWQQSGLILNWKTTSGDYARLIYANDGNVYIDIGDGNWMLIGGPGILANINTKTFWLQSTTDAVNGQEAIDWYFDGKNPIIIYQGKSFLLTDYDDNYIKFVNPDETPIHYMNEGVSSVRATFMYVFFDNDHQFDEVEIEQDIQSVEFLATGIDYSTPYMPEYNGSPTTKYYVDQELLKKQDVLTPGTRITIIKDPNTGDTIISADVSGVMTYKGNVADVSDLGNIQNPSQGDCWYVENSHTMYAWDGTQWNDIGGTGIDLTNYFNLNVNTSDDITEGSIHLFCTAIEKNYWNNKQDKLIAGDNIYFSGVDNNTINAVDTKYTGGNGITVNGTVIDNDSPFAPENAGTMGQFLQKTNDGYKWINPNFVISVNNQTGIVTVDEFTPGNAGTTGQVLKKTDNGYEWQNETAGQYNAGHGITINQTTKTITNSKPFEPTNRGTTGQVIKLNADGTYSWQNDESGGGGGGGGGNFNPDNTGQPGQVLTKKNNGRYDWEDITLPSGENNVKFWTIDTTNDDYTLNQEIVDWVSADNNNGAVLNDVGTNDVFILHNVGYNQGIPRPVFYGKKRSSAKKWVNDIVGGPRGQYTKAWENKLELIERPSGGYFSSVTENNDDATHTNYVSAFGANYDAAFIPQLPSEPATKAYVDQAVAAGPGGVGGITNNITGTTSRLATIWVGSTTELNNISQRDPTCLYFSFSS